MRLRVAFACAAVVAALAGCGADDGTDGMNGDDGKDGRDGRDGRDGTDGESVEIEMLDVGDPDCPNGGTAFTVGGDTTYACNGEMGARGDAGVQGPPGDYQPVTHLGCEVILDLLDANFDLSDSRIVGTDGLQETGLYYAATTYSNDDVFSECRGAVGRLESAAGSFYLPGVTQGAADVRCAYILDYPPTYPAPHFVGQWIYEIDATGPFATYADADDGHPLDGYVYRFTDDDCSVRRVDGDGDWTDITIADL